MKIRRLAMTVLLCIASSLSLPAAAFDEGEPAFVYSPFDQVAGCPTSLTLHQHKGKYVEFLLSDNWENSLTVDERRTMLDRADIVYQYYKEILQTEPAIPTARQSNGLVRIAIVPECFSTDGSNAWTHNGLREMEIVDSAANLQMYKAELARGLETNRQITSHELGHAFDVWSGYLEYEPTCINSSGTNWCHAWTDIWDAFIPYYGRVGGIYEYLAGQDLTADDHQRWWTNNSYAPYYNNLNNLAINWSTAVKAEGFNYPPYKIKARDSWAGIMDRYVQLYGTDAMLKSMAYMKDYVAAHPGSSMSSTTQEQKESLHILSMAFGAKANLSCLLDEWRWYGSVVTQPDQKALRDELTRLYGPPQNNAMCLDNDGDGFTPLKGDCNDSNASVNPLAVETLKGIDDNCNALVDDITPPAPVPLPLAPWGKVAPPAKQGSNYMLSSKMLRLDSPIVSEQPTKIRFWVTGVGVVGTVPYTPDANFLWTPPAGLTGAYGVRAQLMTNTKPVSEFTSAEWFTYGDPCTPDRYEAETMNHSIGNAYDQGWNVFSNGYISFNHTFAGGMQQMTVRAAGQNGAGWPNMLVTVGGVQVFNGTVATAQWTDYTFSFYTQPGSAEVRVYFTNDFFSQPAGQPPVDRNLLVDKVTLASPQCGPFPVPVNLGPVNHEAQFPVSGSQTAVINQLTFSGWAPSQIVLGIGHTDAANLSGVSVSINGGASIALSGDWRTITIPYTGQSVINLTIYSATPRAIRTQWWAQ